jgi:hypothetical protein
MKPGDHIRFPQGDGVAHAIDLGDGTVLHAVPGEGVRRSRLAALAGAAHPEVVTHPTRVYAPKQVVARAFSRLGDATSAAMFADGEAFALWCKLGRLPVPAAAPGAGATPDGPRAAEEADPPASPLARRAVAAADAALAAGGAVKRVARAVEGAAGAVASLAARVLGGRSRPAKSKPKSRPAPRSRSASTSRPASASPRSKSRSGTKAAPSQAAAATRAKKAATAPAKPRRKPAATPKKRVAKSSSPRTRSAAARPARRPGRKPPRTR